MGDGGTYTTGLCVSTGGGGGFCWKGYYFYPFEEDWTIEYYSMFFTAWVVSALKAIRFPLSSWNYDDPIGISFEDFLFYCDWAVSAVIIEVCWD